MSSEKANARTVIVTGGSQGIGAGLVSTFLDRGYRVVIGEVWTWSEARLAGSLAALSAADRAPAIHAMLHGSYDAAKLLEVPTVGTFYELRRR